MVRKKILITNNLNKSTEPWRNRQPPGSIRKRFYLPCFLRLGICTAKAKWDCGPQKQPQSKVSRSVVHGQTETSGVRWFKEINFNTEQDEILIPEKFI